MPTDEPASEPVFVELAEAFRAIPTGSLEREHVAAMVAESRRVQARARRWRRLAPAGPVEAPAARRFAGVAAGVLVAVSIGVGAGSALGLGPWAPGPATIPASPSVPEPRLTPLLSPSQTRDPEPGPSESTKDDRESRATPGGSGGDSTRADDGAGGRDPERTTPKPTATRDDRARGGEEEHEDSGAGGAGEG